MREFKTDKEFKAGEIVTEKDIKKPKKVLKLAFCGGYIQDSGIEGFNVCPVCGEIEGFCFNQVTRNRVELTGKWDIELSFDCSNCAPRGGVLKIDAEYLSVEMVNVEPVERYQIKKFTRIVRKTALGGTDVIETEDILYENENKRIIDEFYKILCEETVDNEYTHYSRVGIKTWKIKK